MTAPVVPGKGTRKATVGLILLIVARWLDVAAHIALAHEQPGPGYVVMALAYTVRMVGSWAASQPPTRST